MKEKFKILLIDDIKENLYSLRLIIEDSFKDIDIIEVTSVKDALIEIMKNEVDLILSDIQMPEASGLELASYLQDIDETKEIPIILITGIYSDDEYKKKAYKSSIKVIDYIAKPIDDEILCSKLRAYKDIFLKRKQDKRDIEEQHRLLIEQIKINSMISSMDRHFTGLKDSITISDDYKDLISDDETLIDVEKLVKKN